MTTTPTAEVFVCSTWNGTLTLRVGDEVGVVGPGYFPGPPTVRTVAKITHKGKRCRVNGREFNERGLEVGERRNPARLIAAEKARKEADPRDNLKAFDHVVGKLRDTLSHILRTHAQAEEFTPLTPEERAEILALLETL